MSKAIYFLCLFLTTTNQLVFAELPPMPSNPVQDTIPAYKLFSKAIKEQQGGNMESANKAYVLAAKQYETFQLWGRVFDCQLRIGQNLMGLGQINEAAIHLIGALEAVNSNPLVFNDSVKAKINYSLGVNHYYQHKYPEALGYYEQSQIHFQQQSPPDSLRIGRVYNNIGIIYSNLRDFERTLTYYQSALEIFQKQNHVPLISAIYNNIGTIYIRKHDYSKALEYYNRSLDLKLKSLGEDHVDISLAYNNIGAVYQESGENDKAKIYYEKALVNRAKNLGPDHPEVALIKRNLGIVYLTDKEYQKALDEFESCLPIWINNLSQNHPEVATLYDHMGSAHMDMKGYEKALALFRQAIPIWKNNFGDKDPDLALSYRNLGNAYTKLKRWDLALQAYDSSLHALTPIPEFAGLSNDSIIDLSLSKPELLATLTEKASALEDSSQVSVQLKPMLLEIASVYELCLLVIDKMILEFDAEGSKLQLGEKTDALIGKAIDNKIRLFQISSDPSYKTQAFLLAEKNKSGRLRESLRELDAKKYSGVPPNVIEREKQLNLDLAHYQRSLQNLYSSNADSLTISTTKSQVFHTSQDKEKLLHELELNYPKYHQYKYQWATNWSSDLNLSNLPAETSLLEFYQGEDSLYFFLVQKEHIAFQKLAIPNNFEERIAAMLRGLRNKDFQAYTNHAYDLYQIIMQPVVTLLEAPEWRNTKNLVIIPDGFLAYIPFETLIRAPASNENYAELDYLLRHYQISYHYSTDLMMSTHVETSNNSTFLGFAPTFVDVNPNLALNERTRAFVDSMPGLPNAREEVQTIADLLDGVAQLGIHATESNFKKIAADYSILHLASHSIIEDEEPLYSKLLFDNEADSIDDGFLHVYELYNMQLNADLVTLSACNTGIGKLYKGEGMVSLARGFLYAGVPNIVMSLWSVSDRPTKDLMTYFYQEMDQGKSKAAALHAAKLTYLEEADNITANPYYWGSFIYLGQVEPQPLWYRTWSMPIIGIVLLILILAGWGWRKFTKSKVV